VKVRYLAIMITKICPVCKKEFPLSRAYFYARTKDGVFISFRKRCKGCIISPEQRKRMNEKTKKWFKDHPKKMREFVAKYQDTNKYKERTRMYLEKRRKIVKLLKYGITEETLEQAKKKQRNKCGICKIDIDESSRDFHIDHDHATGKFRGLLCFRCNLGLGLFKDNSMFLRKAVKYLKKNEKI